jgi:hypothetical protein
MPKNPTVASAPAKNVATNVVLAAIRSDDRFKIHPTQPHETLYAANFICRENGRTVAIEKTPSEGVTVVLADDGSFYVPPEVPRRAFPKYDPRARNFAVNSNFKIAELAHFKPAGFRWPTAGDALRFLDGVCALPRLV